MRNFVIGDIHGAFKALRQCLERSQFDYRKDKLIVLGDVVDRHDEVHECVEELLKIRNLIALRGNHDDWFDLFCQTGSHPEDWIHGGLATARSYLGQGGKTPTVSGNYALAAIIKPADVPKKHRTLFAKMQLYHIDDKGRCFVHAGFNRFLPFTGQIPSTYFWDRELWASALSWQVAERLHPGPPPFKIKTHFEEIFLGHTPTTMWNITVPMQGANVYNLDTGAGQSGKLTIMEVATKKYWQSDPIGTLYGSLASLQG
jgi:serine/threonine protein phosphatase 1